MFNAIFLLLHYLIKEKLAKFMMKILGYWNGDWKTVRFLRKEKWKYGKMNMSRRIYKKFSPFG